MFSQLKFGRVVLTVALAASACLFPLNGVADSLPSGERTLGNATIEPAYNDAHGSIVYLPTGWRRSGRAIPSTRSTRMRWRRSS